MTDITATIGFVQLSKIGHMTVARNRDAGTQDRALAGTDLVPPFIQPGIPRVYYKYDVRLPEEEHSTLIRLLQDEIHPLPFIIFVASMSSPIIEVAP
jgi:dTDP-4-amino-4,6-dideoxygalactose transaminase